MLLLVVLLIGLMLGYFAGLWKATYRLGEAVAEGKVVLTSKHAHCDGCGALWRGLKSAGDFCNSCGARA